MKNYITAEGFGSMIPDNWEIAAEVMNEKLDEMVDALPDDAESWEIKEIECAIWEAYCSGEYDAEIADREAE